MLDTTTAKDLAAKIEWVGLKALSLAERERVASELLRVSSYLPRILALAVWKYFGEEPPEGMATRSARSSLEAFAAREEARTFIRDLMESYDEEADCSN